MQPVACRERGDRPPEAAACADASARPLVAPFEGVCLEWLFAHLDCFAVDWRAAPAEIYRRLKPYAELGLAAFVDPLTPIPGLRDRLRRWLEAHAPEPDALQAVVRAFPQAYPWAGMILQHRAALGVASAALHDAVVDLSRARFVRHFERTVGHEIAVHNVACSIGLDLGPSLEELYARTMLARLAWDDPSDTALYFLCHDVFFLTDWGKRRLPAYVEDREVWLLTFTGWHREQLASGNLDLAAELWLAMSFWDDGPRGRWPRAPDPASSPAEGMPPIPEGQGTGFVRLGDSERQIAFFQNYHTVLVCLMALGRGWTAS